MAGSYAHRIADASGQLLRYGGQPVYEMFCDVVDALADMNDDISHLRSVDGVDETAETAKRAIDAITAKYRLDK